MCEPGLRLRGDQRLVLFFLEAKRRDLGCDRAQELAALREQRADTRALARTLPDRAFALLLGRAQHTNRGGVPITHAGGVRCEAMVGSGNGVRGVERVDHLAEAVAAEEDRECRRGGVALVERNDTLRDVLHREAPFALGSAE